MGTFKDLTNKTFGYLTVVCRVANKKTKIQYLVNCKCGATKTVIGANLLNGCTRSCGCLHKESLRKRIKNKHPSITHGHTINGPSAEYRAWISMKARCLNPRTIEYRHYGGRGITVCKRWATFELFLLDMGDKPTSKHTLERTNVNGNYEPANCVWATHKEQHRNRRNNRKITYKGITKIITDWGLQLHMPSQNIHYYLKKGMSFNEIVKLSPNIKKRTRITIKIF